MSRSISDNEVRSPSAPRASRRVADDSRIQAINQVLLAASDHDALVALAQALHERQLIPAVAFTGNQVARCVARASFDLILLRLPLGDNDLHRLLREIRSHRSEPILVVGQPGGEGRDLADDFLAPDAAVEEVAERAHLLVDLTRPVDLPEPLRWGALELDVRRRTAAWEGDHLDLTALQFRIMEILVLAAGGVVTFEELSRRVWGHSFDDRERLVAHIRRIRKRLGRRRDDPFIVTARGEGFRLDDRSQPPSPRVISLR